MTEKDCLEIESQQEPIENTKSINDTEQITSGQPSENSSSNFCSKVHYAGFWMRFWAYLVDLIVIASIGRLLVNPVFRLLDIPLNSSFYQIKALAPISIVTAIIFYGYFVVMTKLFKQTLGKMIFGLKVVHIEGKELTWGTILFREWVGRFISATTWVGYLIVAFLPKKQGLHDLFSDTTVIHER